MDGLTADLAAMRTRLDTWSHDVSSSLHKLSSEHVSKLQENKVALRNLSTRQQSLEVQAKEVKARLASEQAQVAELQHALGALQEQEQSLPQRVDQLSRVLETKEANIATREKDLAQETAASGKKLQALQQAVDFFQSRLGLSFHQPEDGSSELKLVFTQISEQHPEAAFMVAVQVLDDDTYTVTRCQPPIARMDQLVQDLNKSKQFATFARGVRQEFCKMARGEI